MNIEKLVEDKKNLMKLHEEYTDLNDKYNSLLKSKNNRKKNGTRKSKESIKLAQKYTLNRIITFLITGLIVTGALLSDVGVVLLVFLVMACLTMHSALYVNQYMKLYAMELENQKEYEKEEDNERETLYEKLCKAREEYFALEKDVNASLNVMNKSEIDEYNKLVDEYQEYLFMTEVDATIKKLEEETNKIEADENPTVIVRSIPLK